MPLNCISQDQRRIRLARSSPNKKSKMERILIGPCQFVSTMFNSNHSSQLLLLVLLHPPVSSWYQYAGEELKRRFVYTEELEMLLEYILQERDIEEEDVKWVNVELDSGQKRMLVVLQIGDGISNSVKDTSTKRAIIIAFVDDIPES